MKLADADPAIHSEFNQTNDLDFFYTDETSMTRVVTKEHV